MVERRLKKIMVRTAGLNSRPNTAAPRVPSEKVDVVVLAASHIHIQSDKRWVWFLSLGRTRSIPRDSTPSSRSTIFHNWGEGSKAGWIPGQMEAYLAKDTLVSWDAVHVIVRSTRFSHFLRGFPAVGRFFDIHRGVSHHSANTRRNCPVGGRWEAHTTRRGIQVKIYNSPARNAWRSVTG